MRKVFILLLLFTAPAMAEVRYDFAGTMDSGSWRDNTAGAPVTGFVSFDESAGAPEGFENSPNLALYDSVAHLSINVGGYTFTQPVQNWSWSFNNGAFGPGDAMGTGNAPVSSSDGLSGEAGLNFEGGEDALSDTDADYSDLDQKPWTVKRWFLEVYDGATEAGVQAFELAGNIASFHLASIASAPDVSSHDKYGTYVGTIKDGYPAGSD